MFPLITMWYIWHFRGDLNDADPPLLFFSGSSKHTLVDSQSLGVSMIHCYFKSYETHAGLPISYMEGLWWRRQIGTPLPFYRRDYKGPPRKVKDIHKLQHCLDSDTLSTSTHKTQPHTIHDILMWSKQQSQRVKVYSALIHVCLVTSTAKAPAS